MPKRRRQQDVEIEDWVSGLMRDHSAPAILRELDRAKSAGELSGQVPSLRTIQRLMATLSKSDQTPWSLVDAAADEVGPVLEVLRAPNRHGDFHYRWPTRLEASVIARLRLADAGMPLPLVHLVANTYSGRFGLGSTTDDLDAFLAYSPWVSVERLALYRDAYRLGEVPQVPLKLIGEAIGWLGGNTAIETLSMIKPRLKLDDELARTQGGEQVREDARDDR